MAEHLFKHTEGLREGVVLSHIGSGNLLDSQRVFDINGRLIYAATDGGGRKSRVTGRLYNHDRVVVRPDLGRMVVLDGAGDEALSSVVAEFFLNDNSLTSTEALAEAMKQVDSVWRTEDLPASMASLIAADLDENNNLSVIQAGDTGALIVSKDGTMKIFDAGVRLVDFMPGELVLDAPEIDFVESPKGRRQVNRKVSSKNALNDDWFCALSSQYYPELAHNRSIEDQLFSYKTTKLKSGDMVMLFSDVVWKNFSARELYEIVKISPTAESCFARISDYLEFRFRIKDTTATFCSDLKPKRDNQSLVVFQA